MHPSRPSSTDPNAPYRAAIASLADQPFNEQEVDQLQPASTQYQQNFYDGLAPRINVNRDRLNQIAHHLGSNAQVAQVALELMAPELAQPEMNAWPSFAPALSTQVAATQQTSVRDIQQYLRAMGYPDINMAHQAVQLRLDSVNLSAETILTALQILHDANHPLLAILCVSNNTRIKLINRLVGVVNRVQGFRPEIRSAIQRANNNPDQIIVNLLSFRN